MVKPKQESSQSLKTIRPISAKKVTSIKPVRKKTGKNTESSKLLRRISPKVLSPNTLESFSSKNVTSGRTLSSEFTIIPTEINKTLFKLEREHIDLLSLYSKMSDELLHLKTLEKLDRQKEKQLSQLKNKLAANNREKAELQNIVKGSEGVLKEFLKKMEKGSLNAEDKKSIARAIRELYLDSGIKGSVDSDDGNCDSKVMELWAMIPKLEKVLKDLKK